MLVLITAWRWHLCLTKTISRKGSYITKTGFRKEYKDITNTYTHVSILHLYFLIGVVYNIFHLGNLNIYIALLINGITSIALTWCLFREKSLLYFMILNLPVFAEILSLISYLLIYSSSWVFNSHVI